MTETKTKRTYESQTAHKGQLRLESTRTPTLDQVTPKQYARLSPKQREELLARLIEFLKDF